MPEVSRTEVFGRLDRVGFLIGDCERVTLAGFQGDADVVESRAQDDVERKSPARTGKGLPVAYRQLMPVDPNRKTGRPVVAFAEAHRECIRSAGRVLDKAVPNPNAPIVGRVRQKTGDGLPLAHFC